MTSKDNFRIRINVESISQDLLLRLSESKRPGQDLLNLAQRGLQVELDTQAKLISLKEKEVLGSFSMKRATFRELST